MNEIMAKILAQNQTLIRILCQQQEAQSRERQEDRLRAEEKARREREMESQRKAMADARDFQKLISSTTKLTRANVKKDRGDPGREAMRELVSMQQMEREDVHSWTERVRTQMNLLSMSKNDHLPQGVKDSMSSDLYYRTKVVYSARNSIMQATIDRAASMKGVNGVMELEQSRLIDLMKEVEGQENTSVEEGHTKPEIAVFLGRGTGDAVPAVLDTMSVSNFIAPWALENLEEGTDYRVADHPAEILEGARGDKFTVSSHVYLSLRVALETGKDRGEAMSHRFGVMEIAGEAILLGIPFLQDHRVAIQGDGAGRWKICVDDAPYGSQHWKVTSNRPARHCCIIRAPNEELLKGWRPSEQRAALTADEEKELAALVREYEEKGIFSPHEAPPKARVPGER